MHPKALLRFGDELLKSTLRLLFLCECKGRWPGLSTDVIIALLPKPTGGRRPIGLFPWLPKIWAKIRRKTADRWEKDNARPYLYAEAGRGAEVASWKQSARGELAVYVPSSTYGMTFIDLVKAFDRIPFHVLVQQAIKLGYSLWVLRLTIAAYKAPRTIRIEGAV